MSSIPTSRPHRRGGATLSSLIYASALRLVASFIHGPSGRVAIKERSAPRSPDRQSAVHAPREAGKGADTPSDIPSRGWWAILKRTFSEVSSDRVLAVAGGVTFYGLLSLFPAVTVLVSVYGLVAEPDSISRQLQMLGTFLPQGALSIIGEQVTRIVESDQSSLSLAAIAGVLVAMWSANAATKAMMDALNIAYDAEEKRGFIKLNFVSLGFTLSAILGLVIMIAVVAAVPVILKMFWLGGVADVLIWAGRWPLIFGLIIVALAVLYRYGPSRPNVRWRWITPGSLLAALALVIFSMLFSWYAANFGKFNETYGSLGAAIGFMTWMWLSAAIVLVGAELNAEVENHARPGPKPGETGAEKK